MPKRYDTLYQRGVSVSKRHKLKHDVVLEYKFDRLHECKLAQAYELLVPYQRGKIGRETKTQIDDVFKEHSHLCKSVFGTAT